MKSLGCCPDRVLTLRALRETPTDVMQRPNNWLSVTRYLGIGRRMPQILSVGSFCWLVARRSGLAPGQRSIRISFRTISIRRFHRSRGVLLLFGAPPDSPIPRHGEETRSGHKGGYQRLIEAPYLPFRHFVKVQPIIASPTCRVSDCASAQNGDKLATSRFAS